MNSRFSGIRLYAVVIGVLAAMALSMVAEGTPLPGQRSIIGTAEHVKLTATDHRATATLGISKTIQTDGEPAENLGFRYRYRCANQAGYAVARADGQVVEALANIPLGTICQITEEPLTEAIAGYTDTTPTVERIKEVRLHKEGLTTVEFIGSYQQEFGRFRVAHEVVAPSGGGDQAPLDIDYRCTHPHGSTITGEIVAIQPGGHKESADVPAGYTCFSTPRLPRATLTAVGSPITVAATNLPTIPITSMFANPGGEYVIAKQLSPRHGQSAAFTFQYHCVAPTGDYHGTLGSIGPGQRASSPPIPSDHTCTITQAQGPAQAEFGQDSITSIEAGGETLAETTTTYSNWEGELEVGLDIRGVDKQASKLQPAAASVRYRCVRAGAVTNEGEVQVGHQQTARIERIAAYATCVLNIQPPSSGRIRLDAATSQSETQIKAGITGDQGRARVTLPAAYVELGTFSVAKERTDQDERCAFEMHASWVDNGVETATKFELRQGEQFGEFPPLPVGTKVRIKQQRPAGENYTRWCTPGFTSTHAGALIDGGNGSAEFMVVPNTPADDPQRISLSETKETPWWWRIVPLAVTNS